MQSWKILENPPSLLLLLVLLFLFLFRSSGEGIWDVDAVVVAVAVLFSPRVWEKLSVSRKTVLQEEQKTLEPKKRTRTMKKRMRIGSRCSKEEKKKAFARKVKVCFVAEALLRV